MIKIDGRRGMHLQGQFDWQLPGDRFQVDSRLICISSKEKTTELAITAADAQTGPVEDQRWLTYPLP